MGDGYPNTDLVLKDNNCGFQMKELASGILLNQSVSLGHTSERPQATHSSVYRSLDSLIVYLTVRARI